MYIGITTALLIAVFFILLFHWRKKRIICKVCAMSACHKYQLLNELIEPLGYRYDIQQDIFTSRQDAWQKQYGYGEIYDRLAPHFNMVFDCQPVYFDYKEKTWLIEFWKGQYGINTGSEIGIYHADGIVPPAARSFTIFHAADEDEFLKLSTRLYDRGSFIAEQKGTTWWLTIFSMGRFTQPHELALRTYIRFPDLEMRDAFLDALIADGYDRDSIKICCNEISFLFCYVHRQMNLLKYIYCHYVLLKNFLFCKLYCFVTRPFEDTCSKLLYLYFYLPFAFRRMLRLKHFCRKRRRLHEL